MEKLKPSLLKLWFLEDSKHPFIIIITAVVISFLLAAVYEGSRVKSTVRYRKDIAFAWVSGSRYQSFIS